jgi:hypothetical protein
MHSMSRRITRCRALWRRTFLAFRISTSCRRRRRKLASRTLRGSGGMVGKTGRRLPISARNRASTRVGLGETSVARANSRACRGLTRANAIPRAASALDQRPVSTVRSLDDDEGRRVDAGDPGGVARVRVSILKRAPSAACDVEPGAGRPQPMTICGRVSLLSMSCQSNRSKQLFRLKAKRCVSTVCSSA